VGCHDAILEARPDIAGNILPSRCVTNVGGTDAVDVCAANVTLGVYERHVFVENPSCRIHANYRDFHDAIMKPGRETCSFNVDHGEPSISELHWSRHLSSSSTPEGHDDVDSW
jgi:hypothetical protein